MNEMSPKIAIIDPNTLAALGLRQLLQSAIPFIEVDTFGSIEELIGSKEQYMHYFVVFQCFLQFGRQLQNQSRQCPQQVYMGCF